MSSSVLVHVPPVLIHLSVSQLHLFYDDTPYSIYTLEATFYELYNVVPFNDSLLTTNSSGCFPTRYTVVCRNISQAKLSDGITGPTDILSGNLEQFFALSRYAEGSIGRLTIGFAAPVSVAVIYFFNSPTDYIGLPEIKVYKNINAPINYTFSNDNNLNQNDSQLRNITLEFSEKLIIVQIDFVFPNNSRINWFLISEVKFYNCKSLLHTTNCVTVYQ